MGVLYVLQLMEFVTYILCFTVITLSQWFWKMSWYFWSFPRLVIVVSLMDFWEFCLELGTFLYYVLDGQSQSWQIFGLQCSFVMRYQCVKRECQNRVLVITTPLLPGWGWEGLAWSDRHISWAYYYNGKYCEKKFSVNPAVQHFI